MASYCSVTDVSNELNGLSITSSSVPSSATVSDWITQESEILSKETNRVWGSETATNEYQDYDGSGIIRTNYAPILSMASASYEENGIDAPTESWVAITEGRISTANYYVYKEEGELRLHGSLNIPAGYQNVKLTYTYGYATTPATVKSIIAKRVALRVIGTVINGQASEEGGSVTVGAISITDPSSISLERVVSLKTDIQELVATLGKFKTYRYNRRWD